MAGKILTYDDYFKILQNRFNTKEIDCIIEKWEPLSDNIEGYMGDHEILKLTYSSNKKQRTEMFFVKTKPQVYTAKIEWPNLYEKEIFFYEFFMREVKKMSCDNTFTPKVYFSKDDKTMVMENLTMNGYRVFDRNRFYDINHCKVSLKSLAQLHAYSIIYEQQKTKEFGRQFRLNLEFPEVFNEVMFVKNDEKAPGLRFFNSCIQSLIKLCDFLPETTEWKQSFKNKLKTFDYISVFHQILPYRKTIGHGDLWTNNMLFRYKDDISQSRPIHCCLIDFQLLRYGHPAYDVILLIHCNTEKEFRDENKSLLLKYYYETFKNILISNGCDPQKILAEKDFFKTVKSLESVAVFHAVAIRNLVKIPQEIINKALESKITSLEEIIYGSRNDIVVRSFCKYDWLRKMYIDDIYEMQEILK